MQSNIYNKKLESKLLSGLYIVATPIGNMRDISHRALNILEKSDLILCENPIFSGKLLAKYQIKNKLEQYNDFATEHHRKKIIQLISEGNAVSLISDAGTPTISDPGFKLVREVLEHDLKTYSIPGASAVIAALSISGLPSDNFHFYGFLPKTTILRQKKFTEIKNINGSLIFYETAKRIIHSLEDALPFFASNQISLSREITKIHEETLTGTLEEILETLKKRDSIKGEFVLIISNIVIEDLNHLKAKEILKDILQHLKLKEAVSLATKILPMKRNALYKLALEISES